MNFLEVYTQPTGTAIIITLRRNIGPNMYENYKAGKFETVSM